MAANLIKAGHTVTVYNRSREKTQPLLDMGASPADNPGAAIAGKTLFMTMLSTPAAVREVSEQMLPVAQSGSLWINCSTIDPATAREMAEQANKCGVHYLDAPVKGSTTPAANATLIFLVGGEEQHIETAAPLFQAMGKEVRHTGPVGTGSALKLVFNQLLAQQMVILGEATRLAEASGINRQVWLDQVIGDIVSPPFLSAKAHKFHQQHYAAEFPLCWMHKDLSLSLQEAELAGVDLPAAKAGLAYYADALRDGKGDQDFTGIFECFTANNQPL